MPVEQLICVTLKMQGFRIESVKRRVPNWLSLSFPIFVTIPVAGCVTVPAITWTRSLKDNFAMCPYGRYQLPWSMLPAVSRALNASLSM
ncbi:MAG: hypothetical protein AB9919_01340 [Geobacteraceae bacterium]